MGFIDGIFGGEKVILEQYVELRGSAPQTIEAELKAQITDIPLVVRFEKLAIPPSTVELLKKELSKMENRKLTPQYQDTKKLVDLVESDKIDTYKLRITTKSKDVTQGGINQIKANLINFLKTNNYTR